MATKVPICMTHQLHRSTDPHTSAQAAAGASEFQRQHYARIVTALIILGPAGKDGIAKAAGLDGVAVARRLTEMHRAGMVLLTGKTVASDTGRAEREWVLA